MPTVLIVNNTARYTIQGTYLGRAADNVLDVYIDTPGSGGQRSDAVPAVAAQLINTWADDIVPHLAPGYSFNQVSYVDLDSETGVVGTANATSEHVLPATGGLTGENYAANVAILVTKQTDARRGQRTGRIYLAGVTEGIITGSTLASGYLTDLQSGLSAFLEDMTETGVLTDYQYYPVVTHTHNEGTPTAPVIVVDGTSQIHDLSPQSRVASQRRRNRS